MTELVRNRSTEHSTQGIALQECEAGSLPWRCAHDAFAFID